MSEEVIPAWKQHGRKGPFDWWLGCQAHGFEFVERFCLSCVIAQRHNERIEEQLAMEREESEDKQ